MRVIGLLFALVTSFQILFALPPLQQTKPAAKQTTSPEVPAILEEANGPLRYHTGDLDGMRQRRMIRAAVFMNKTNYFIDSAGRPRGISYEALTEFERFINQKLSPKDKTGKNRILVVLVPTTPTSCESDLLKGKVDIVALPIFINEENRKKADFVATGGMREDVVISGPDAPVLGSLDDLAGKEVYLSPASTTWKRLTERSGQLKAKGKPSIRMKESDVNLQWEDQIEMANAGMIQYTVVPLHIATLWKNVFPALRIYSSFPVVEKLETGWAVRKDSPKLKTLLEGFAKGHRVGTSFGNTLVSRYLKNPQFIKNNRSPQSLRRFQELGPLFRKYSDKYDLLWLVVAAEAYQESGLNQAARSPSGAVGVMQILPSTAAHPPVSIRDVTKVDRNIEAGVKMLHYIYYEYFKDAPMDPVNKGLITLAAYNAGPARIAQCRQLAAKLELDPNVWFNNVEYAVAKRVGTETVTYVSNIYKYYIGYKLHESELTSAASKKPPTAKSKPSKKK